MVGIEENLKEVFATWKGGGNIIDLFIIRKKKGGDGMGEGVIGAHKLPLEWYITGEYVTEIANITNSHLLGKGGEKTQDRVWKYMSIVFAHVKYA